MKKRLPFVPTVIIALTVLFLIYACGVWLEETFNAPDWVWSFFSVVGLYSFFEVASRLGPKEFDTPTLAFLKLSVRDRLVSIIAILIFLIIAFPVASYFASRWLRFLFFAIGALLGWLICAVFGSAELKKEIGLKSNNAAGPQEE